MTTIIRQNERGGRQIWCLTTDIKLLHTQIPRGPVAIDPDDLRDSGDVSIGENPGVCLSATDALLTHVGHIGFWGPRPTISKEPRLQHGFCRSPILTPFGPCLIERTP